MRYFLDWLDQYLGERPSVSLEEILDSSDKVVVVSADMVNGFCHEGPLASERVEGIVQPVVSLLNKCVDHGIKDFGLIQEYHSSDASEFKQYGPHCIGGTPEAETIDEIKLALFGTKAEIFHKNTIRPSSVFDYWLDDVLGRSKKNPTVIVVGNCTDLCLYQAAMDVMLNSNDIDDHVRVIVPMNCVQTYDLPVETAEQIGALPHDGDLLHKIFLYHMALNGVELVKEIV